MWLVVEKHDLTVGKYMPSELDNYIALREVHIYRAAPLETVGGGGGYAQRRVV
jgi:hypothetical protein